MKFWNPIDDIDGQRVAIDLIDDCQFHRGIYISSFFVATNMQVPMIGPVIGEFVNQPGIPMEVEDNGLVDCKQTVEIAIAQTVRVFPVRLQPEQVDYIDESNFEVGKLRPQQSSSCQRFLSGNISAAGHH